MSATLNPQAILEEYQTGHTGRILSKDIDMLKDEAGAVGETIVHALTKAGVGNDEAIAYAQQVVAEHAKAAVLEAQKGRQL